MPGKRSPRIADKALNERLGKRLRSLRVAKGVSQEKLARQCDISFQQVQKYERGDSRISIDRLAEMAAALDTSVEEIVRRIEDGADEGELIAPDRGTLTTIRNYKRLPPDLRRVVRRFIKDLADTQDGSSTQDSDDAEPAEGEG